MAERRYKLVDNPANNPTRQWQEDDATVLELILLLRGLTPAQRQLLSRLVGAEFVETGSDQDRADAARINKLGEAFGFVSLIDVEERRMQLAGGAGGALQRAFANSDTPRE